MGSNYREDAVDEVSLLSELGLSKYEASVYHALIFDGPCAAKGISNVTGIPYGKIYEVIEALERKGFVHIIPSKPMKYLAVSPKSVLESTKKNITEKLQFIESHLLKRLEPLFQSTKNSSQEKSLFLLLNGRANIYRKVEKIIQNAKKNVNILTTENGLKRLVSYKEVLEEAHQRNVVIRVSAPLTRENEEDAQALSFCLLENVQSSENTMYSFDGEKAFIIEHLPDDENYISGRDLGIYLQSPSFTKLIDVFFNTHFESSSASEKEGSSVECVQSLNSPPKA